MQIHRLDPGFSIADASYPSISSTPGKLRMAFNNSQGQPVFVAFSGVPAFRWQEGELPLESGEPFDGSCEFFGTEWLSLHVEGRTMNSGHQLRHLRFNFNAWGSLEVLCSSFSVNNVSRESFIEVRKNAFETVVGGNREGLIQLASQILRLAETETSGAHYHLDEASIADSADINVVFSVKKAPWG